MPSESRNRFRANIFLTDVPGGALIAAGPIYRCQRLWLDWYGAAVVFFINTIFQNFAEIRRLLLTGRKKKGIISEVVLSENVSMELE
ncbi:MAG: small basic family protein [Oscillospiraceae bacterium]|nr:small basic family protein [Oscillospiraceae bacterium]